VDRRWEPVTTTFSEGALRRPLSIALASLVAAALVVPTAQAATRRYDFQDLGQQGQMRIQIAVFYKNKQRHGRYTPRLALYDSAVPVSCNPPVSTPSAPSGGPPSFGTPNQNFIKMKKGSFTYSYSYEIPSSITGGAPGHTSGTGTGKVVKKQANKPLRVEGSVSILDWEYPTFGMHNCTSGGPVPYSATPCRYPVLPPYIKKSLPFCAPDI
jgi:hypothetical protein